jgi:hypothetical protein
MRYEECPTPIRTQQRNTMKISRTFKRSKVLLNDIIPKSICIIKNIGVNTSLCAKRPQQPSLLYQGNSPPEPAYKMQKPSENTEKTANQNNDRTQITVSTMNETTLK